jgi:hypothetical protein
MHTSGRFLPLLGLLAVGAFATPAEAQGIKPIEPIAPIPAIKQIAPIKPIAAIKPIAPIAPIAAPKALTAARATLGKPAGAGTTAAFAPPARVQIVAEVSDPGMKVRVDEATGRVFVTGTAHGPLVKRLAGYHDYEESRGVSFQLDRDRMPDFSREPNYKATNEWYESHLAQTSTRKGDSALTVAKRLATNLERGGKYEAHVTESPDGAAVITLERL